MTALAREIMNTPVFSVTENQSIKEVITLLAKHRISGVPVVDEKNILVGIISDTDIVRYSHQDSVIPFTDLSGWISPYADISDLASLRKGIDLLSRTKVSRVMSKKVISAEADSSIVEIAKMMSRRKINRIPIIDKEGRLLGIITRADLVFSMSEEE